MTKYIRVPLTAEMEKDYRECAEMMDNGEEKDCEGCSMNGGSQFECMGEYPWRMDDGWIPVDDERLWDILFEEACVEGEQARRIYNRLKETFDGERSEMNGKL